VIFAYPPFAPGGYTENSERVNDITFVHAIALIASAVHLPTVTGDATIQYYGFLAAGTARGLMVPQSALLNTAVPSCVHLSEIALAEFFVLDTK
jgi:hypothetical protein